MARKREITGKAVIYTSEGVKVVDAEVRRRFNIALDTCEFKFDYDGEYLLIGGARTVSTDNIHAQAAYNPQRIQQAVNYGNCKFFKLMLDLMSLAQWEPINKANPPLDCESLRSNQVPITNSSGIEFDKQGAELDAQFYQKYDFTPAMVDFTEAHYQ